MEPFKKLEGVAAPLNMINVDTDMIIPKQFLKTIHRTGLGKALFDEMRYNARRQREAGFRAQQAGLPQGADPGGGREFRLRLVSREHAPWALLDFGIRCVIAPSFADIFYNNCFKNGILPIALPQAEVDKLMDDAERGANAVVSRRSGEAGNPRPRWRHDQIRDRSLPQAMPAQWLGRYRPDPARRGQDLGLTRSGTNTQAPWL